MDSVTDNPCGLGFPIRRSAGQRVLASRRSLSQRATSFIACVCQGIPQTPLLKRLIAQQFVPCPERKPDCEIVSRIPQSIRSRISYDQFLVSYGSTGRATGGSRLHNVMDTHQSRILEETGSKLVTCSVECPAAVLLEQPALLRRAQGFVSARSAQQNLSVVEPIGIEPTT